jgi:hypothetical protein
MKKPFLSLLLALAPVYAQNSTEPDEDARKLRSAAISAEVGMNSLSSLVGIKGTLFVAPQWAVDLGLGLSNAGLRPGLYGRYLFSTEKFSPFVYAGAKYGLGSGGTPIKVTDPDTDIEYEFEIKPSAFVDFGVGIDYLAHNGFYFTGGLGWSQLMTGSNYEWVGAAPPQKFDDVMEFIMGSGLALSLSLGYGF